MVLVVRLVFMRLVNSGSSTGEIAFERTNDLVCIKGTATNGVLGAFLESDTPVTPLNMADIICQPPDGCCTFLVARCLTIRES